jgi:hypothetical protein
VLPINPTQQRQAMIRAPCTYTCQTHTFAMPAAPQGPENLPLLEHMHAVSPPPSQGLALPRPLPPLTCSGRPQPHHKHPQAACGGLLRHAPRLLPQRDGADVELLYAVNGAQREGVLLG